MALDSDLDVFIGDKFESPYILYTRGYSWENDVYHPDLVKEQLNGLIFTADLPSEYCEIVEESYEFFDKCAFRILRLELIFRKNNLKLITDCTGERFINGKSKPRLKMDQVAKLVKERNPLLIRPLKMPDNYVDVCPVRYCYGKLREALAIAIISYIGCKLNGIKSLPKELLVAPMIERYRNRKGHEEDKYYEILINNLLII